MIHPKYIPSIILNLWYNFKFLSKFNISNLEKEIQSQKQYISILKKLKFIDDIKKFNYLFRDYQEEIGFILKTNSFNIFPYAQEKKIESQIICNIDNDYSLPYIIHNGHKLFFPQKWSSEQCISYYRDLIERENLLGGNFTTKAPHQYQTESFKIESNDILLDIGCAEGLLALDSIDHVKFIYLFEGDPQWIPALSATFAPFKNKVKFFSKYVLDKESNNSISLNSLFNNTTKESFFVKMDIEGAEKTVLIGNNSFFTSQNNIKLACCTYHKKNDAKQISNLLETWHYSYSFSDGYMLYFADEDFSYPYFRKGLIRAIYMGRLT